MAVSDRLPSHIDICGVRYSVQEVASVDAADSYGECDYQKSVIKIRKELSHEVKLKAFVHECMHALMFESGAFHVFKIAKRGKVTEPELEEMQIDQITGGLIEVFSQIFKK